MRNIQNPIHVTGLKIRTSNKNKQSFSDIPTLWARFMQENTPEKISDKLSSDIYAVYTDFEHEGKNNEGMYTLIIGCATNSKVEKNKQLVSTTIPAGHYKPFPVENNDPEKVGKAWQEIWKRPEAEKADWSFKCEFERYHASGEIEIFIGLKGTS